MKSFDISRLSRTRFEIFIAREISLQRFAPSLKESHRAMC
jgi:hypothetical protein